MSYLEDHLRLNYKNLPWGSPISIEQEENEKAHHQTDMCMWPLRKKRWQSASI